MERELGVKLPARLAIHVHEETPDALHLVPPLSTATFDEAVIRRVELGDREVIDYADKGDLIYINTARRGLGAVDRGTDDFSRRSSGRSNSPSGAAGDGHHAITGPCHFRTATPAP